MRKNEKVEADIMQTGFKISFTHPKGARTQYNYRGTNEDYRNVVIIDWTNPNKKYFVLRNGLYHEYNRKELYENVLIDLLNQPDILARNLRHEIKRECEQIMNQAGVLQNDLNVDHLTIIRDALKKVA